VFVAAGAHRGLKLGLNGEQSKGVVDAVELLRNLNLEYKIEIGERVAVVGGGNAAIDAARTLKRLGKEVTILYRRTRNEMPAWEAEVDEAIAEGIDIQFLTAPVRIISEKGRIKKIECIRMELGEVDRSGRRKPVPVKDSEFIMEIDTLVPAISQEPELKGIAGHDGINLTKYNTIEVDSETLYTGTGGIFAGGDTVNGPGTVTEAMSHGKIAAEMIDRYVHGMSLERQYSVTKPAEDVELLELTDAEIESMERFDMPMLQLSDRTGNFRETELGFSDYQATCEARHCLRCDREEKE
jgi:NADH-quinone oxidoreductase subunit F